MTRTLKKKMAARVLAEDVSVLQAPCVVSLPFERIVYQQKVSGRDSRLLVTGCGNTHAADSADVLGAKRIVVISASFILFREMRSLDKKLGWLLFVLHLNILFRMVDL